MTKISMQIKKGNGTRKKRGELESRKDETRNEIGKEREEKKRNVSKRVQRGEIIICCSFGKFIGSLLHEYLRINLIVCKRGEEC